MDSLRRWTARRWATAALVAMLVTFAIGIPTDVIPTPVFGRPTTPVTWWSYPVLGITAILAGLLAATYVREASFASARDDEPDPPARTGTLAGVLSFFAVGCPTCNKLVVVAVGTSGALDWFAPAQPVLAIGSVALLGWALRARLRSVVDCRIPGRPLPGDIMAG